jgi:hypothetical protein
MREIEESNLTNERRGIRVGEGVSYPMSLEV